MKLDKEQAAMLGEAAKLFVEFAKTKDDAFRMSTTGAFGSGVLFAIGACKAHVCFLCKFFDKAKQNCLLRECPIEKKYVDTSIKVIKLAVWDKVHNKTTD